MFSGAGTAPLPNGWRPAARPSSGPLVAADPTSRARPRRRSFRGRDARLPPRPGDGREVAQRQTGHQRLEGLVDRDVLLAGPALEAGALDRLALADDLVDEIGVVVAEEGPDRVQARLGQRLEEGAVVACFCAHPPVRLPTTSPTVLPTSPPLLSPPPPPPTLFVTSVGTVVTSVGTVGVLVGTWTSGSCVLLVLPPPPLWSDAPPPPSAWIDFCRGPASSAPPEAFGFAAAACCVAPAPAPAAAVAGAVGVVLVAPGVVAVVLAGLRVVDRLVAARVGDAATVVARPGADRAATGAEELVESSSPSEDRPAGPTARTAPVFCEVTAPAPPPATAIVAAVATALVQPAAAGSNCVALADQWASAPAWCEPSPPPAPPRPSRRFWRKNGIGSQAAIFAPTPVLAGMTSPSPAE